MTETWNEIFQPHWDGSTGIGICEWVTPAEARRIMEDTESDEPEIEISERFWYLAEYRAKRWEEKVLGSWAGPYRREVLAHIALLDMPEFIAFLKTLARLDKNVAEEPCPQNCPDAEEQSR